MPALALDQVQSSFETGLKQSTDLKSSAVTRHGSHVVCRGAEDKEYIRRVWEKSHEKCGP